MMKQKTCCSTSCYYNSYVIQFFFFIICLQANIYSTYAVVNPPYFTVVGARTLRPDTAYHVAVSMQGDPKRQLYSTTTVQISIEGRLDAGGLFSTTQTATVEPFVTRVVKLEIGDIGPGDYNLTAIAVPDNGGGGSTFRQTKELEYVPKSYSVFIQTDKAIYKPGHTIRFRCIVLDKRLRPGVTGSIDVRITDGGGNRVKQWIRALTSKGVFSGELPLSESPVLGDWNITVVVLNQTFTKSVHVAEYVLPKFEVKVDAPKHATFVDGKIPITVRARYTYDRRVKGELTVSAYPLIYSGILQPIFQAPVRHVLPIHGDATIEIDLASELQLGDEYERPIVVEAIVEEALTGRRQNSSTRVIVHKYPYRLQLFKSSEYYKPGLEYSAQLYVSKHDGTPAKGSVIIRHGFSYDSEKYTANEYQLDSQGLVDLKFKTPASNHTVLGIEAQYENLKEWFSAVTASSSLNGVFIQTTLLTATPAINSDVEVRVECTEPFAYVTYEVLGRGDVLAANMIRSNGDRTAVLRFPVTPPMTPTAHLIVHLVTNSGELIADALDFDIEGSLQNFVDIDTNVQETAPGKDVDITIRTKPNSYVGLLGIDQSVLALRKGNDLSLEEVEQELRSYDSGHASPYRNNEGEPMPLIWRPGTETAYNAFQDSGAIVLTNSEVAEMHPMLYYRSNELDDSFLLNNEIPQGDANTESHRIRKNFIEAWLWDAIDSGVDGRTSVRRTVPDSITSWVISAFSVDPVWGLGLMKMPKKLRVFQPFFVSLDLPYSVRRGEIVAISIVIHNYMDRDVSTEVTLDNTDQAFEFAEVSNEISDAQPKIELYRKKTLIVPKNGGAGISFMITPKKLGFMDIKVTATSSVAGDTVHKPLLVVAEGETQYMNKAIFIDLRNNPFLKTNITLDIPKNIIPGSEYIEISAAGDILGPTILNLDQLIRMPHGCGEQNMLNLVPNILVLEYLKNTQQITPAISNKAIKFMEVGYQQELTYKRPDGSFSAFGTSDPNGSVWLTAFVARSFRKAAAFISVEESIIDGALKWLAENQALNGSFPEVGKVSHQEMQGGAGRGIALTAYVLVTFLEAGQMYSSKYANTIDKAVDYISRNLGREENIYATAVSAYALQLSNHPAKQTALNLLDTFANVTKDMKWWEVRVPEYEQNNPWRSMPNALNIEITSYAMLALMQSGLFEDCLPILKWLIMQRNQNGGFTSTQDTVIGLQALSELGASFAQGSRYPNLQIKYEYQQDTISEFSINQQNYMILQKHQIPKKTRFLNISAEGNGFGILQVSFRYNVNVTGAWPMFTLDPQVDRNSNRNHLQLSICSGFVGNRNDSVDAQSNMAVMEVNLPSGYTVDSEALPSLRASPHVKRVETRDSNTQVVLYFDHMHRKQEYCPTVSAFRTHKVARQVPVPVTLYDYYDTARKARVFYEARTATLCDICEGENCGNVCSNNPDLQKADADGDDKGGVSSVLPSTIITLLLLSLPFIY
ncbi:CD109 antigen-like isoform X2 [Chrysoperla carnea]|uniref:CD109 antigen-like isoform X2 n=1 Tax=Chrysoperla carnea TaxID=189513 RepID=UPI001D06B024|nr:CD109 antigen-like isoform X2 [Chrysoperla carnea]